MTLPDDEEFTELVDGHFPRVDLVGKAANGVGRFLIAKSAEEPGMVSADVVRDLVAKAEASTASMNDRPDSDFAYIEPGGTKDESSKTTPRSLRHFPIYDAAHVRNALSRAPQSPFGEKAMPKIRAAAKKLGVEVSKEMFDDLDASEVLADGADEKAGLPGDAEWETVDADTALKWTGILSRAKYAIDALAERECAEGEGGEYQALVDAACAVDYAIGVLATFAVGEKAEAEMLGEIAKACATLEGSMDSVATIEMTTPVIKAGRVLSTQNETRIREAVASLTQVLQTLPAAPATDAVAKEGALTETSPHEENSVDSAADPSAGMPGSGDNPDDANDGHEMTPTSDTTDRSGEADAVGAGSGVMKAEKPALMAVYTQGGKLLGAINPEDITPLQDGGEAEEAPEEAPAEPVTEESQLVPAQSGTVGMAPEEAPVAKNQADETDVAEVVKAALAERDAEHASVVKALEDRLAALEAPAPSRVLRNGALPPTHMLRGMDQGSGEVDITKAEELRSAFENASSSTAREEIAKQMNENAVTLLTRMRQQ